MSTSEASRATVLHFCQCLSRRDYAAMSELVTSDATWWVVGRPDYAPYGGLHSFAEVLQKMEGMLGTLEEFTFTAHGSIADGEQVAIEATSAGRKGTARYKNVYLMRYRLRDGKIDSVREFFDAYELTDYHKQVASDTA